jgi:hypothetical protein
MVIENVFPKLYWGIKVPMGDDYWWVVNGYDIEILKYESQQEAKKAANDMGWKMFKIEPIQEEIDK